MNDLTNYMGIPKKLNPLTGQYEDPTEADLLQLADLLNAAGVPTAPPVAVQPAPAAMPAAPVEDLDAKRAAGVEFLASMNPGSRVAVDYDPATGAKTRVKIDGSRQPTAAPTEGGAADGLAQINDLMKRVYAMSQPGYRGAAIDPAYSSVEYASGMPIEKIVQTPEYKQLQLMMGLEKQKKEATPAKLPTEKDKAAEFVRNYRMYESMPDSPMKENFAREMGLTAAAPKAQSEIAKIESDFKQGLISQEQRDIALSGTAGGKAQQKLTDAQLKAKKTLEARLTGMDRDLTQIDQLILPSGAPTEALKSYAGPFDIYTPDWFESAATGKSALEPLRSRATISNLAEAKKLAEQSFGAMSVKEWPRFENYEQMLDPSLPQNVLAKNVQAFQRDILKAQNILREQLGNMEAGATAPAAAQGGWAIRPKGQ